MAAIAWPLADSMNPSGDILALAEVEVDLTPIAAGQGVVISWQGRPVFVRHRTPDEIAAAENTPMAALRDPAPDSARVKPEHAAWLVVIGICTHLGLRAGRQQVDRAPGRVWRLVLCLPRQPVRHRGAHPQRSGAGQPADAALRLPVRHQGQDRLNDTGLRPARPEVADF